MGAPVVSPGPDIERLLSSDFQRQGQPTWDGNGVPILYEDFSGGLRHWNRSNCFLARNHVRKGNQVSAQITVAGGSLSRGVSLPVLGNIGVEVSFHMSFAEDPNSFMSFAFLIGNGVTEADYSFQWTKNGLILYATSGAVVNLPARYTNSVPLHPSDSYFHTVKIVVDALKKYRRIILDEDTFLVTAPPQYLQPSVNLNHGLFLQVGYGGTNLLSPMYFADIIVTVNEPN